MCIRDRYVQAHEGRAILHAHKIEDMLDKVEAGEMDFNVARVSIDARKWLATKYYPRMFGERQQLEVKTLDVTKAYVEQLKMLMQNPSKRIKKVSAIEIEDKGEENGSKGQEDKEV